MAHQPEKPLFLDVNTADTTQQSSKDRLLSEAVALCRTQLFAVLATHDAQQSITASLVAFAADDALRRFVFFTPKNTAKFDHISQNPSVSLLVDNRCDHSSGLNRIAALTVTGRAEVLQSPSQKSPWLKMFLQKHPNMAEFADAPNTAMVCVIAQKHLLVSKFQQVFAFDPHTENIHPGI